MGLKRLWFTLLGWSLGGIVLLGRRMGRLGAPLVHLGFGLRCRLGLDRLPRVMTPTPAMAGGSRSAANLTALLDGRSASRFLEIGVFEGRCLEAVPATWRVGVDPGPLLRSDAPLPRGTTVHHVGSDEFFAQLGRDASFDVIFVDGLHQFRQAYRDVLNAAHHLEAGGFILMDDVVPSSAATASSERPQDRGDWMGDVFRAVLAIAEHHGDAFEWRTFEAPARRFQTVLWLTGQTPELVTEAHLARFDSVTYEAAFSDGVPPGFHLNTRADAIAALRAARDASPGRGIG